MRIVTFPDGVQVNADTGEVVGQGAPAKVTAPGAGASPRQALNISDPNEGAGRTALDALQQFSWGFNSALFALPDAVVQQVGRAAGVREDQIPTFTRYFNTGQVAPETMLERFTNTIGKGAGSGMAFTGVLGTVARTNALRSPLTADAGTMKRVAKDTLDYIRKNPAGAVAADTAFGGVYGALEQTVEETMEEGTGKEFAKATVPMAGILAVPAVLSFAGKLVSLSPTVQGVKAVAQQFGNPQNPQNILVQDVMQDDVINRMLRQNAPKIPGLGFVINTTQSLMAKRAAKQMRIIEEELADPTRADVQQAVKTYQDLVTFMKTDPLMQQINASERFLLDSAQISLYGPLMRERNRIVRDLTGPALRQEQVRQETMEKMFAEAFDVLAPRAPLQFDDALRIYWADDQNSLMQALKQIKDLSEAEATRVADRFAAIDLNDVGNSIRRDVMAQMDGQFYKLQKEALDIDAARTTQSGIPMPTRIGGDAAYGLPAADFQVFGTKMLNKYKLSSGERIFISNAAPGPVRQIERYMKAIQKEKDKYIEEALDAIIIREVNKDMPAGAQFTKETTPNFDEIKKIILGKSTKETLPARVPGSMQTTGGRSSVQVALPTFMNTPAKRAAILKQVDDEAMGMVNFQITSPEAIDLLGSALRYKNAAFLDFNKRIEMGLPRYQAQRVLDVSNNIKHDIEEFVRKSFSNSPDMERFLFKYDETFKEGYEQYFPMLISKKRATGEPYVSSEAVVSNALKSGDNIRALNLIMGADNPLYNKTMTDVMFDQAYRANVVNKEGLLDPAKYNRWLASKQNIINAMPAKVRDALQDEANIAENVMQRLRDMQKRIDDGRDLDFEALVKKAVRPGADTNQLIATAISDPASMKLLVDRLGKTPQNLESLRRRIWDQVRGDLYNPDNPTYLKDFLQKNGKSLNMVYEPQHMDNLRHLAEIQHRIFSAERVLGKESPFMSADEKLRAMIGSGFGTLESTVRTATVRMISPMHAGVTLLTRLISQQQHNVYEAIMYKALTDPKYAQALANSTAPAVSPQGVAQVGKLLADAGYPYATLVRPAIKIGGIEAVQATMPEDQELPVRQAPARPTLPQLPGAQAPAAPSASRPLSQSPVMQAVPPLPQQQDTQGTYEQFSRLFPNDFLSPMIQQQAPPPQP